VVALKTVKMADNTPAHLLARFDQEAVSLARLQHPNIVAVYDCGHTGGRAFFAMELLDGEDLERRIERSGPLPERVAWLVARQTAAALDHAAKHGVIHRDVKPANLFLVPPPTGFPLPSGVPMVKVTDFGLARTLRGADETDPGQTAVGVIMGTPVYMAPEQFLGGHVGIQADIYSLGVTVYQALTGAVPFDGRTLLNVVAQKSAPPPRLSGTCSEETTALVAAMMALDAGQRPASYAELIARIDALPCLDGAFTAAGLPITPPTRPAPAGAGPVPARKSWVYALAGAVLLGGTVAAAALAGAFGRSPARSPLGPPGPPAGLASRATYTTVVEIHDLLDTNNTREWAAPFYSVRTDDEGTPALTGTGVARRRLPSVAHSRVRLALDLHEAATVDVVLAVAPGPPHIAEQWLVRVDRTGGAALCKRAGPGGVPVPLGPTVPVPTAAELNAKDEPRSRKLVCTRAGGTLSATFNGQPLGSAPCAAPPAAELRVETTGGSVRIEEATIEELAADR
jgi:hypothetical protein